MPLKTYSAFQKPELELRSRHPQTFIEKNESPCRPWLLWPLVDVLRSSGLLDCSRLHHPGRCCTWWAFSTMTVKEADTGRASFAGPTWRGGLKTPALEEILLFSLPPGEAGKGALKVRAAATCLCFSDAETKGRKQSQGARTGNRRWRGRRRRRTEDAPGWTCSCAPESRVILVVPPSTLAGRGAAREGPVQCRPTSQSQAFSPQPLMTLPLSLPLFPTCIPCPPPHAALEPDPTLRTLPEQAG